MKALNKRQSKREFSSKELTKQQLSDMLEFSTHRRMIKGWEAKEET